MNVLNYSTYYDKVLGGWLGKCIGGACGALSENNKNILHYTIDNVFPEVIPPNDDLDLQILWLQEGLEKIGVGMTREDFGALFAKYNVCLANEYAVSIRNINLGILPPVSGTYDNSYFLNSMGCPIRSEIWALLAPGSFRTVKRYAEMDGSVDHGSESIYGEIFNAIIEAAAFFETDREALIEIALKEIPSDCRQYKSIHFALACYREQTDWATARNRLVRKFGSMDASYSVVNLGLTMLAFLYGEGDYTKTLLYAVNGGYDTDCTAATALSILGIMAGAERTPQFWKDKIGNELVVGTVDIDCRYPTIEAFAKATCAAGLSFREAGLWDVQLTGIPAEAVPSLPEPLQKPLSIEVCYQGSPVIGIGEESVLLLTVKNHTPEEVSGVLEIRGPDYLVCSLSSVSLTLCPQAETTLTLNIKAPETLCALPMKNLFQATCCGVSRDFGLFGAMRMKLFGPYWDNYDTTQYPEDPYEEKMQKLPNGDGDIHAMFNGFVNINREYLPEDFQQLPQDFEWVNIHGSEFDLEPAVTYRGPACVYLVHEFTLEHAVPNGHFHFGCNAPAKIWVNGELVLDNQAYYAWTIFNCTAPASLKAGKNRIIFKLSRTDAFRFSVFCRNWEDRGRFICNITSLGE
ncbi:ADP-ribosylglycohydrolase family protein [Hydrogeniiclostridium mannosilyticum]|uniref:ADP-ribosylglycohydrolase family protein n=1 Tax=Hydrogeniiclostridium mannosilyticum TaxID=2764322 RepID=UPI00399B20B2